MPPWPFLSSRNVNKRRYQQENKKQTLPLSRWLLLHLWSQDSCVRSQQLLHSSAMYSRILLQQRFRDSAWPRTVSEWLPLSHICSRRCQSMRSRRVLPGRRQHGAVTLRPWNFKQVQPRLAFLHHPNVHAFLLFVSLHAHCDHVSVQSLWTDQVHEMPHWYSVPRLFHAKTTGMPRRLRVRQGRALSLVEAMPAGLFLRRRYDDDKRHISPTAASEQVSTRHLLLNRCQD